MKQKKVDRQTDTERHTWIPVIAWAAELQGLTMDQSIHSDAFQSTRVWHLPSPHFQNSETGC